MNMIFLWLIASIFFLTIELLNPGFFFFLAFFTGCLGAALAVPVAASLIQQGIVFLATSLFMFIILRYWVGSHYNFSHSHYQSNAYALIGKRGSVLMEITPLTPGQVKVRGEVWSAKSHEAVIEKGSVVEVINVIGCHIIVKQVNNLS
jgi:membrane protein implicated in regulation of membrane protease activity